MEQTSTPAGKLPSISTVLSTSWQSGTKHLGELAPEVAPFALAIVLYYAFMAFMPTLMWLGTLVLLVASVYTNITVGRMMYDLTMNGKINKETAKKDVMKVFWPLLLLSILLGIIVGVGLMLLVIPGIILAMIYFAAPWAVIVDGKSVGDAMSMSAKLTKGRRLQLFWITLVVGIVWGVVFGLASGILMTLLGAIGGGADSALGVFLGGLGAAALLFVFYPIMTSVKAFLYGHLKKLAN